jgi:hypothetical protein
MRLIFLYAAIITMASTSTSLAGGEKKMKQLLAEDYKFVAVNEKFAILQADSGLMSKGEGAYFCELDPTQLLKSLREAICEPLQSD